KLHPRDVFRYGISDRQINAGLWLLKFNAVLIGKPLRLLIADRGVLQIIGNAKRSDAITLTTNVSPHQPGTGLSLALFAIPEVKAARHQRLPMRFSAWVETSSGGSCFQLCVANGSRHRAFGTNMEQKSVIQIDQYKD